MNRNMTEQLYSVTFVNPLSGAQQREYVMAESISAIKDKYKEKEMLEIQLFTYPRYPIISRNHHTEMKKTLQEKRKTRKPSPHITEGAIAYVSKIHVEDSVEWAPCSHCRLPWKFHRLHESTYTVYHPKLDQFHAPSEETDS